MGRTFQLFLLACAPHQEGVGHPRFFTYLPHVKSAQLYILGPMTKKEILVLPQPQFWLAYKPSY